MKGKKHTLNVTQRVASGQAVMEMDGPALVGDSHENLIAGSTPDTHVESDRDDHEPDSTLLPTGISEAESPPDEEGLLRLQPAENADQDPDDSNHESIWFSDEADAVDLRLEPGNASLDRSAGTDDDETPDADSVGTIDDHSAADDVILVAQRAEVVDLKSIVSEQPESTPSTTTATGRPMPPLPKPGEIAKIAARVPTHPTPQRIGSGRLVPARLTWKPRDPFASDPEVPRRRFRWEVMLTTACGTAMCGMGTIWLLRAIVS